MKPHKHKDLIIAWANGATIECKKYYKNHFSIELSEFWEVTHNPSWNEHTEYRIKPREFEIGAWYPAMRAGDKVIVKYQNLLFWNGPTGLNPEGFSWIGEPLDIDWPEAE